MKFLKKYYIYIFILIIGNIIFNFIYAIIKTLTSKNIGATSESFTETLYGNNQNLSESDTISLNTLYRGQIAQNDGKDFYKFTLTSSGEINISLEAYIYRTN